MNLFESLLARPIKFVAPLLVYCITLALLSLAVLAPPKAKAAGPMPFTQNQFPLFWLTQTAPVTNTGTAEGVLFQATIPPSAIGAFLKTTLFLNGDAANTQHVVTVYLGGTGATTNGGTAPTGATAISTNTFTTSVNLPVTSWLMPLAGNAITNRVWSSATTNSVNTALLQQQKVVGTQTNGILLTVTGSGQGAGVQTILDAVVIEALGQ